MWGQKTDMFRLLFAITLSDTNMPTSQNLYTLRPPPCRMRERRSVEWCIDFEQNTSRWVVVVGKRGGTDIIFLEFKVGIGEFTVWIGQGHSEVEGCRGCGRCVSIVRQPIIPVLIPACHLTTTRTSHNSNNSPLLGTPAQLDIFRRLRLGKWRLFTCAFPFSFAWVSRTCSMG
jgi:hypothetical protein